MSSNPPLDALYAAFSHRRLRLTSYCAHCWDDAEVQALKRVGLRELTWQQLEPTIFSWGGTLGSLEDACAVLPRLVEVGLPLYAPDLERFGASLPLTHPERFALKAYRTTQLASTLTADEPPPHLLDELEHTDLDWAKLRSLFSDDHVPRWVAQLVCELGTYRETLNDRQSVLADAVLEAHLHPAMETAFFRAEAAEDLRLFSNATLVLEWF